MGSTGESMHVNVHRSRCFTANNGSDDGWKLPLLGHWDTERALMIWP